MKNLILNNYHPIDQNKRFLSFIENNFIENQEIWNHFQEAFWKENRKETIKRFFSLHSGDNILCHTVFVRFAQLELMINLLYEFIEKDIKISFYISSHALIETLNKFYNKYESEICPDIPKYNNNPDLREEFKNDINAKLLKVLDYHNIYELDELFYDEEKPTPIRSKDIILD